MPSLSALAVDDYAPSRYAHIRILKRAGFDVYEAADGNTGLALAQVYLDHVILLDVNLPDIHGFEECQRRKASAATRHIPVIHLTATSRGDRYQRESIDSGAALFLEAPVEDQELVRVVNNLISAPRTMVERVLLLSPYEDEREMYEATLQNAGYQVSCASPEDGYELARKALPDIVVTRIRPGEAGLNLARSLKTDPVTADVPVVVITTYPDARHRAAAERAGVAAYFVLPLAPDDLVAVVAKLIGRK